MFRNYLISGEKVELNNHQYTIDKVVGEGATCIVYSATYVDDRKHLHRVNIKECYPHKANIVRDGQTILWNSEDEKNHSFEQFYDSYDKLMNIQNVAKLKNSTAHGLDICKANGTLYYILDFNDGKTFDEVECSVGDSLKTVKALAETVGKYHSNGYLHLDIKPSNFLTIDETREFVILFDMDTVVRMDDIKSGKVNAVSFSEGWAAPEQKRGLLSKLCPATDIYAIGAILFEKVMDRKVDVSDLSVFADWDFDNEKFESLNPKIKRLLRNIFKKTLSANIKRRYQDVGQLIEDLDEAIITVSKGTPYIIPQGVYCINAFIGRSKEISNIEEKLNEYSIAVVKGMHGIGKSELVRRFAMLHSDYYDQIVLLNYKDTIEETLTYIDICNFEGTKKEHIKELQKLCDDRTLLIIDAVDSDVIDFQVLQKLKCHIIITTCFDWDEINPNITISVEALQEEEQLKLFAHEYGVIIEKNQEETIKDILSVIEGYTLLIPLIAKQLKKWGISLETFLVNIRENGIKNAAKGKVRHLKDGNVISGSVYAVLQYVLNFAELDEREIYVLKNMALLNQYSIYQELLLDIVGEDYDEVIDNLVYSGWIYRQNSNSEIHVYMHTVIAQMCYEEYKPTIGDCSGIRDFLWAYACEFNDYHKNLVAEYLGGYAPMIVKSAVQHRFDSFLELIYDVVSNSDINDAASRQVCIRIIEKISNVMYGDIERFEPYLMDVLELSLEEEINYSANAALAIQASKLKQDNIVAAYLYSYVAVNMLQFSHNIEELAFRVCFNFYQYICCKYMEEEYYWEGQAFDEMVTFTKDLWEKIIEHNAIDSEDNNVIVLSKGEYSDTVMDMIKIAFKDFCWRVSDEAIEEVKKRNSILFSTEDDAFDELNDIKKAYEIKRKSEMELLTDHEIELVNQATQIRTQLNELLPIGVLDSGNMWMLIGDLEYDKLKTEDMHRKVLELDPMIDYYCPPLEGMSEMLVELTKMEAAFTYIYAITADLENYNYHVDNLLKYYRNVIDARKTFSRFKAPSISQLPGALDLLYKPEHIIQLNETIRIINLIMEMMEEYCQEQGYSFSILFEDYEKALEIAKEADDTITTIHYEQRIKDVTEVHFEKK